MSVSISEVARRARVSISTVSRVVNGSSVVNPLTKARVEQAIAELGYQPNAFARGLTLRRSEIIGLVLPDLHGEFYSEIIRGANSQARDLGYELLISSMRDGDRGPVLDSSQRYLALLDGVVLMFAEADDNARDLLSRVALPFVLLDDDMPGVPHDSVIIDQQAGARKLAEHLVDTRGVQRLIFVGGPATNLDTREREAACREVMRRSGRRLDDGDIHYLNYEFETAYAFARRSLSGWVGPGACVFAANDEMAAGIVTAALEAGVTIPGDLGIVGFDDTRIAAMMRPALTTARVPMAEMGSRAVELLCRRLAKPDSPPTQIKLEPTLVIRDSCRVPRR